MLKRSFAAFFLAFTVLALGPRISVGYAVDYTYDQNHSLVEFSLKHFGLTTAAGYFVTFSGSSRFFAEDIGRSEVNIQIHTASIREPAREDREPILRSEKFFWSDKYPYIQFMSRKFIKITESEFNIEGSLTIRGVTHPAVFHTKLLTDPAGITERHPLFFTASTFIKRKDYNLGTGNWTDTLSAMPVESLEIRLRVKCLPVSSNKAAA